MYINNSINNQKNNTSFKGLTKQLGKKIYIDGQKDIEKLLDKHPNTLPVCGQLPEFMTYRIPKENRKTAIREILDTFNNITLQIRNFIPTGNSSMNEICKQRPDSAVEELNKTLKKHKVIRPFIDDDVDLVYLDKGGKGAVYKIEGLRGYTSKKANKITDEPDEFVIKVYHQLKGEDWHPFKSHGAFAESNSANYWTKNEGRYTQRGKFFFADLRNGHMVNKFLDADTRLPQRVVDEYKRGIKPTDEDKFEMNVKVIEGYNRIKGYNYDWGGNRIINRIKNENKIARTVYNDMRDVRDKNPKYLEQEWERTFNSRRANIDDVRAGLALSIKYMKPERKNEYLNKCIDLNKPVVDQALSYVLKYIPYEDSLPYYTKLLKRNNPKTQTILLNEIPLMAKKTNPNEPIHDDLSAQFVQVIPERVERYYNIAERHIHPEAMEHLASFIHLLPEKSIPKHYEKLAKSGNDALYERLIYKFKNLPKDYKSEAKQLLNENIETQKLKDKLNHLN